MPISARVKKWLDRHRVSYQVLNYKRTVQIEEVIQKLRLPCEKILKAVPLSNGVKNILAVLPWEYEIDLMSIQLELKSKFQQLSDEENQVYFCDCEKNSIPSFGEAYHFDVILDKSLEKLDFVYLETGSHSTMLEMSIDDFLFLNADALSFSFAYKSSEKRKENAFVTSMKQQKRGELPLAPCASKFAEISTTFPSLPCLAQRIMKLVTAFMQSKTDTPFAKTSDLFPSEPRYFKFGAFDQVALAFATHQVFKLPKEVYLGSKTFWQYALYAAHLSEMLGRLSPHSMDPSQCYLLGFTHNFGFLVFGHLFFQEYRLLSKWIQQNPQEPIERLEKRLLGMGKGVHMVGNGHTELGAWLMEYWGMADVFIAVAKDHHAAKYEGPYYREIALIQLVNQLLTKAGIAKEIFAVPMEKNLKLLGLTIDVAENTLEKLMQHTAFEINILDKNLEEEMVLNLAS